MGKELFTAAGPSVVKELSDRGFDVFLDLKFHDIPNTVAKALSAAADLGVWMANVHASGGSRMMSAAKQALGNSGSDMLLIGVTILRWSSAALLAKRIPGVTNLKSFPKASFNVLASCAEQTTPSRPESLVMLARCKT